MAYETDEKFDEAPELFPELTYVTVDSFASILSSDKARYKVLVFNVAYTFNDNWSKIISREIIPRWRAMDTAQISLYLITCNCAYLNETDSFFRVNNISGLRYVIRDTVEHERLSLTSNLSECINVWLSHWSKNADMLTEYVCFRNTVVLDSALNMKLGLFYFPEAEGVKAMILPMPFEFINPFVTDFSSVERCIVDEDNYICYWYFNHD